MAGAQSYILVEGRHGLGTECGDARSAALPLRDVDGALVKVHVGDEVMVRQVQAAGGYLSQSSKTLHFGMGDRKAIDRVEILRAPGRVR